VEIFYGFFFLLLTLELHCKFETLNSLVFLLGDFVLVDRLRKLVVGFKVPCRAKCFLDLIFLKKTILFGCCLMLLK